MAEPHLDRRQLLRAALLGAAGLAVPAACGLPSGGRPVVDGPAPTTGPGSREPNRKAPTPADALTPSALVLNFLGAVAGPLRIEGDLTAAGERARAFLHPSLRASWVAGSQITVVRKIGDVAARTGDQGSTFVDATLLPVGVLQLSGTVTPLLTANPGPVPVRFTVVPNTEADRPGPYQISEIQPGTSGSLSGMLLDSAYLDSDLYTPQLIYFWSTDNQRRGLVPDLRYLPLVGVSLEIQLTEIVDWVLAGPSDLVSNAVLGNQYSGNSLFVPNLTAPDNDGLLINLTAPPPQSLGNESAMAQLRWSLRPLYTGSVRLEVNSAPQQVDGASPAYQRRNLADQPFRSGDQTEYCVANGVVRPVADPTNPPQVLMADPETNKGVRLAALSRDLRYAALVKTDNRLYIGGGADSSKPLFIAAQLSGQHWTRPAFLPANTPQVLVGVDGQLYLVQPGGQANPLAIRIPVAAFSVAPDGHRIGLISGGAAYVCGLKVNGDDISFGQLRQIDAGLSDCTGIAWSRLDRVLIAGQSDNPPQYKLVEATIDGAIATSWQLFAAPIVSVVAAPRLPSLPSSPGAAMVQTANGIAYEAFPSRNPLLSFQLSGVPSPSPSAGGTQQGFGAPTNPFYLD